jgi:hypothetical protein
LQGLVVPVAAFVLSPWGKPVWMDVCVCSGMWAWMWTWM